MSGRKVVLIIDNFSAHQSAVDELSVLLAKYSLRNTKIV